MPKVITKSPVAEELPEALKPYHAHGLDLKYKGNASEAVADCPFCGGVKKFMVNVGSGQWYCFTCTAGADPEKGNRPGGNVYTFLRCLHEDLMKRTEPSRLAQLRKDRGLLFDETLTEWGVCWSSLKNCWLIPGYGAEGKLNNLYRYIGLKNTKTGEYKKRLLPTPGINQQLHLPRTFCADKPEVIICEGPWDAMVLYETLKYTKLSKGEEGSVSGALTGNRKAAAFETTQVVATPGANVFSEHWLPLFAGKNVTLLYDNDHPKENPIGSGRFVQAGYDGLKRAVQVLGLGSPPAEKVSYLYWGEKGYNESLPSGADVRDWLTLTQSKSERAKHLGDLLSNVKPAESDWMSTAGASAPPGIVKMEALDCTTYKALENQARKALKFIDGLNVTFSAMLASVISTMTKNEPLWVRVIGPASSGKTTLAEAISIADKYVYATSTFRGFHSGYKTDAKGTEDHSLISQIIGKTLIIKDGDTLLQSQDLGRIMSETRDIFDRKSRAHYRHGVRRDYQNIPMNFILCGTNALHSLDSSELGERFLTVKIMREIDDSIELDILRRKISQAFAACEEESNGKPESQYPAEMATFMRMTAGYVNYLRENATALNKKVEKPESVGEQYINYARFIAFMRAQPSTRQHKSAEREISTRLLGQITTLGTFTAVVLNKTSIEDAEVQRRVKRVIMDSSHGVSYRVVSHLYKSGDAGCVIDDIAAAVVEQPDDLKKLLQFMRKIKMIEPRQVPMPGGVRAPVRYRLTKTIRTLYEEVTRE